MNVQGRREAVKAGEAGGVVASEKLLRIDVGRRMVEEEILRQENSERRCRSSRRSGINEEAVKLKDEKE